MAKKKLYEFTVYNYKKYATVILASNKKKAKKKAEEIVERVNSDIEKRYELLEEVGEDANMWLEDLVDIRDGKSHDANYEVD